LKSTVLVQCAVCADSVRQTVMPVDSIEILQHC